MWHWDSKTLALFQAMGTCIAVHVFPVLRAHCDDGRNAAKPVTTHPIPGALTQSPGTTES